MAIYKTGAVRVTNGSRNVVGINTAFVSASVRGGDLSVSGLSVPIETVNSETSLTLAYNWPGANVETDGYAISYTFGADIQADILRRLNENVQRLRGISAKGRELTEKETAAEMRTVLEIARIGAALETSNLTFSRGTILRDIMDGGIERAYWNINGDRLEIVSEANDAFIVTFSLSDGPRWANQHRMWHAGNDGAGSGLDADTLDGLEGAAYQSWDNIAARRGPIPAQHLPVRSDVLGNVGSSVIGVYAENPGGRYETTQATIPGNRLDDPKTAGNRYFGLGTWICAGWCGTLPSGRELHKWVRIV